MVPLLLTGVSSTLESRAMAGKTVLFVRTRLSSEVETEIPWVLHSQCLAPPLGWGLLYTKAVSLSRTKTPYGEQQLLGVCARNPAHPAGKSQRMALVR